MIAVLGGYIELRLAQAIPEAVEHETSDIPVISHAKIEAMEGDIADNKEYIRKTEDKVERIVDILLEE